MHRSSFSVSRLLASAAFGLLSLSLTAHAQDANNKVVVLTGYPPEMTTLYKNAFEKTHPGTTLEILPSKSGEALTTLRKPDSNVDVYWAPSPRNFLALAKEGGFQRLTLATGSLPFGIGGFPISDPAGYYAGFEMAGYGFAVNPQRLQQKGLSQPTDWTDLTDNKWKDEIILPQPSKIGFAPLMVDIILQSYGWERGWAILQAIGANAQLIGERGGNIADDIGKGQASVGLSIDYLINIAIAKGAPITFAYPAVGGYSIAHIAVLKNAPHANQAQAFVEFALSPDGQKILFDPRIRKLPVRPSVYAAKPNGSFDPFTAKITLPAIFNPQRALTRQDLNNVLFDLLITDTQLQLREVLDTITRAERAAAKAADPKLIEQARQARLLSAAVPFNAVQATGYVEQFNSPSAVSQDRNADLIAKWKKQISKNRSNAEQMGEQVLRSTGQY
jgi:phosphoglycerate transport regulatory protein PgtC